MTEPTIDEINAYADLIEQRPGEDFTSYILRKQHALSSVFTPEQQIKAALRVLNQRLSERRRVMVMAGDGEGTIEKMRNR